MECYFQSLGAQIQTLDIWHAILDARLLDYDTPKLSSKLEKANQLLKALSFLMKALNADNTQFGYSKTIELLEWIVLPQITGSKAALRDLRLKPKAVYPNCTRTSQFFSFCSLVLPQ